MAALPQLVTVEEFRQLPEGELQYELHLGEVVSMTRPKHRHLILQLRLFELLTPLLKSFGRVATEVPYRPLPEFDLRVADVAAVSRARWDGIDPEDNLRGAPELVVEVKSPSNTERQLRELVSICLGSGAVEVWIADMDRKSITRFRPDSIPAVFSSGESIPLAAFGGGDLAVDEIFP
jgi:Uma2 family endonuclease